MYLSVQNSKIYTDDNFRYKTTLQKAKIGRKINYMLCPNSDNKRWNDESEKLLESCIHSDMPTVNMYCVWRLNNVNNSSNDEGDGQDEGFGYDNEKGGHVVPVFYSQDVDRKRLKWDSAL